MKFENVLPDALYDCRDGRVFIPLAAPVLSTISEAWRFRNILRE